MSNALLLEARLRGESAVIIGAIKTYDTFHCTGRTCTQLFIILITTEKASTNKSPNMFTHLKRVYAKITATVLKLVLCCHLVDNGEGKSVLLQNAIYIYIYISIKKCFI